MGEMFDMIDMIDMIGRSKTIQEHLYHYDYSKFGQCWSKHPLHVLSSL
jgi:hypothetical protein